jgi:predicted amidohydrolase
MILLQDFQLFGKDGARPLPGTSAGYRIGKNVPLVDAAFLERAWERVSAAAAGAKVAVILGTERIASGRLMISTLVFNPDGSRAGFQDKEQLDPSEDSTFTPGEGRRVFQLGAMTFGMSICHEGFRYPETVRALARQGAHIVFHPHFAEAEPGSFRPTTWGDPANTFHESTARCRAAENTCYFATVNCAGEGSPTTSAVAGPDGALICAQPYGQSGLLIADIDLDAATRRLAKRLKTPAAAAF